MAQFRWNPIYGKFDLVDNAPTDGAIQIITVDDVDLNVTAISQPTPSDVTPVAGRTFLTGENGIVIYKLPNVGPSDNYFMVAFGHNQVQTIGAETKTLLTFATVTDESFRIQILVSATADDGSVIGGNNFYTVKNIAGVLSIVEEPDLILDSDAPLANATASVSASGTDFILTVTGVLDRTINWGACTPGIITTSKP